jgi:Flp pilus assembly protein TadG
MKNLVSLVRSFCVHRSGNIVIPFALTFGFVVLVIGAGLDYSRAHNTKVVLQAAVDATALAANYDSEGLAEAKVKANAVDYFNAIYKGDPEAVKLDVTVEKGTVTVSATQAVQTLFGGMLNVDKVDVGVRSQTVIGKATFDVVMVLDNSGSMGGSKMRTLKDASEDLTKTLFAINEKGEKKDRVKIGLVPFTSFVNIGGDKENESWMDREGQSPIHWTNFETRPDGTPDPNEMESQFFYNGKPSRFTLFKQLKHTKWLGCVEARPVPYDVTDDAPDRRVPKRSMCRSSPPTSRTENTPVAAIAIPTTTSATIPGDVATRRRRKRASLASPNISMRRSACASTATRTSPSATPIPRVRTTPAALSRSPT